MCQDLEMTNKHLKLELSRVAALTDEVLTYAMSVYAHYTHSLCPIMQTLHILSVGICTLYTAPCSQ